MDLTAISEVTEQDSIEILKVQQLYCRNVLNVPAGGRAIVTNGRIVGPLEETEKFILDDFSLLERYSMSSYGDKILQTLKRKTVDDDDDDDGNTYLFCLFCEILSVSGKINDFMRTVFNFFNLPKNGSLHKLCH